MTRKDFELIARTVSVLYVRGFSPSQVREVAERFAESLATTNHAFNRARFLRACGVEVQS